MYAHCDAVQAAAGSDEVPARRPFDETERGGVVGISGEGGSGLRGRDAVGQDGDFAAGHLEAFRLLLIIGVDILSSSPGTRRAGLRRRILQRRTWGQRQLACKTGEIMARDRARLTLPTGATTRRTRSSADGVRIADGWSLMRGLRLSWSPWPGTRQCWGLC
jgi:hypothetical protein